MKFSLDYVVFFVNIVLMLIIITLMYDYIFCYDEVKYTSNRHPFICKTIIVKDNIDNKKINLNDIIVTQNKIENMLNGLKILITFNKVINSYTYLIYNPEEHFAPITLPEEKYKKIQDIIEKIF